MVQMRREITADKSFPTAWEQAVGEGFGSGQPM